MFIGDKTINKMKTVFMNEIEELFPKVMQQFAGNMKKELDLGDIVYTKISSFGSDRLEEVLYQAMSKELRMVGIFVGTIGFLIGLFEVFIISIVR